jgi:pimeloyl-ACP methyl ester carboxylesterase
MTSTFRHQGIAFRYQTIGKGEPLVFCHGLGGDLEQPKQLLGEIPGWRLIVWDCRLHGQTQQDTETEAMTFDVMATDLAALLNHLDIDRAVVGGISMGAGIAVRFAVNQPGRARALILVRPAWTDSPHPPNLSLLAQIGIWLEEFEPADVQKTLEDDPRFKSVSQVSGDCAESLRQQCMKPLARQQSLRLREMPAAVPLRPNESPQLTQPVLIIGNDCDPMHPLELAEWWASQLGALATLHQVPSKTHDVAGHRSAIRQHIQQFLAALPAQGPESRGERLHR